jgi:hypothetical protein
MSLPLLAFTLAARNQLQWGEPGRNHIRLFLIQESDAEGIGLELARMVSDSPACLETRVRYLMWSGAPDNVTFCQCMDEQSGAALSATPGACSE